MVKARLNALGEKLDLYLITANELIRAAIRHESGVRHFEHCVFRDLRREDEKTGRREDDKTRKREDDAVEKKLSMNCSSKDDCVTNTIHSKLRVIIH